MPYCKVLARQLLRVYKTNISTRLTNSQQRYLQMKRSRQVLLAFMAAVATLLLSVPQLKAAQPPLTRSLFQVEKLSCISCLAAIEEKIRTFPEAVGMNSIISQGLVSVDHRAGLSPEQIAAEISALGYPARVIGYAALAETAATGYNNNATGGGSGCGSRSGCGGGSVAGPAVWAPEIIAAKQTRKTTFDVANLTCTSCLATIAAELRTMKGTGGVAADFNRGQMSVAHDETIDPKTLAAAITDLGYPATVVSNTLLNESGPDNSFSTTPPATGFGRRGIGCSGNGPCAASAPAASATWKKLYNKYVSKSER